MKKIHVLLLVLLAASTGALYAQAAEGFVFRSFQQNDSLLPGTPASVDTALGGYLNPAVLGMMTGPNLLLTLSNAPGQWGTFSEIGAFSASPGAGVGLLYFLAPDGQPQVDIRFGIGLGSRSFAFGVANELSWRPQSSQSSLFRAITVGAVARPWPYLSLGVTGSSLYSGSAMEATVDLGLRPLGTPFLTLFGDYTLGSAGGELSNAWKIGAALEPWAWLRIAGSFSSDSAFNLGAQIRLGAMDVGTAVHFGDNALPDSNTYYLGAGRKTGPSLVDTLSPRKPFYLELDLRGNVTAAQSTPFSGSLSLLRLLTAITEAADDPRVAGIAVNTSGMVADHETLWELRQELAAFKSKGKHVVIFVDMPGLAAYYLASVADRIVMDPQGVLVLNGYVFGRGYFKGTLDKLGIGFEELRYFEYKSAAESLSRDSLSDADRRQYGAYIEDLYRVTKEAIVEGRGITAEAFESAVNDLYLIGAQEALEHRLVDSLGRWEEVEKVVESLEGEKKVFLKSGAGRTADGLTAGLPTGPVAQKAATDRWGEPPRIALVYAIGSTALDSGMRARSLAKDIAEAADASSVKAIVVRVDSPGGDAVAADYVAEAIKAARKKKPVIVTMGSVAGSGGYWVSMYADSIVASPYTLTGSIGVIGSWIYDNGLNSKLGLTTDQIQVGKHADLSVGVLLPHRDLTPEERERFKTWILAMYDDFLGKVAEGRGMTREQVESIAQGRIWSGLQAREIRLVDALGGVEDAVALARQKAGLSMEEEALIVEYPRPSFLSFLPFLAAQAVGTRMAEGVADAAKAAGAGDLLSVLAGAAGLLSLDERTLESLKLRLEHNGAPLPVMPLGSELVY
jgi:protease-4